MPGIRTLVPVIGIALVLTGGPAAAVDSDPAPAASNDLDNGRKAIDELFARSFSKA